MSALFLFPPLILCLLCCFVVAQDTLQSASSLLRGLEASGSTKNSYSNSNSVECEQYLSRHRSHAEQYRHRWKDPVLSRLLDKPTPKDKPYSWKLWWDFFEPYWSCNDEEEVGPVHDGHKWMCGLDALRDSTTTTTDNPCLVYSYGSAGDTSFEQALYERTGKRCKIHVFDPTPGFGSEAKQNAHAQQSFSGSFHSWGLGGGKDAQMRLEGWTAHKSHASTFPVETVMKTLKRLGESSLNSSSVSASSTTTIDVLKIDCEGCEWDAMLPIIAACKSSSLVLGQLQLEMHIMWNNPEKGTEAQRERLALGKNREVQLQRRMTRVFKGLEEHCNLKIFHKEPNLKGCDGYKCLEYGFVNVKEQCRRKRVAAFASGGALQVADAPECVCGLDDV